MPHPVPCYLVEWYRSAVDDERLGETAARLSECAASMTAGGSPVRLQRITTATDLEVSRAS